MQPAGAATKSDQLPTGVTAPPPPIENRETAPKPDTPTANPATPRSTIVGQAWYAGPQCGVASYPPRCNGPYRRTQVAIWSHATGRWLRNSVTDDDGRYRFDVDPGWYTLVLVTGYGDTPYWFAKFSAPPAETLTQNLVVDLGQR